MIGWSLFVSLLFTVPFLHHCTIRARTHERVSERSQARSLFSLYLPLDIFYWNRCHTVYHINHTTTHTHIRTTTTSIYESDCALWAQLSLSRADNKYDPSIKVSNYQTLSACQTNQPASQPAYQLNSTTTLTLRLLPSTPEPTSIDTSSASVGYHTYLLPSTTHFAPLRLRHPPRSLDHTASPPPVAQLACIVLGTH